MFPYGSKVYRFYLGSVTEDGESEYMLINIAVREFSDSSVAFYPVKPLSIESRFVNFNLSALAAGPLQRFYLEDDVEDHNIKLEFVNYFSTINMANLNKSIALHRKGGLGIESPKQIALNLQLKLLNPVFSFYYSSYIHNCVLKFTREIVEFQIDCNNSDVINFKSSISANVSTKLIVLAKDKWMQYSNTSLELCTIVGESGQCQLLPIQMVGNREPIDRIKLVNFESKISGETSINIFIICKTHLYYGIFSRGIGASSFQYSCIFEITAK